MCRMKQQDIFDEEEIMAKFNLQDTKFCKKLIAVLLFIILVSSLGAALISSDFGKVKISHVACVY